MHAVAVHVEQELHLDVPRLVEVALEVDAAVAEARLGLARRRAERRLHAGCGVDDADALAAAARGRLERDRIADALRVLPRRACVGDGIGRAGHDRHAGRLHRAARLDLVAHRLDGLGRRPDPLESGIAYGARERGVLREESVAWMDRLRARLLRRSEDLVGDEVRLRGHVAVERHRHVRHARVQRFRVPVRVDRDGLDVHLARGADDAQGDLAAVGDEDALEHGARRIAFPRERPPLLACREIAKRAVSRRSGTILREYAHLGMLRARAEARNVMRVHARQARIVECASVPAWTPSSRIPG